MGQQNQIDEPEISEEHVNRRIEDWLRRLDDLFTRIKNWAVLNGWSVEERESVPMHEELMERFGVPTKELPSLSVRSPDGAEIWVKPKGLWVIGANGRVDLYSRKGAFTLVDIADQFQAPRWILHRLGNTQGQSFDPKQLEDMV